MTSRDLSPWGSWARHAARMIRDDPAHVEYWSGYLHGLRRAEEGDRYAGADEHARWLGMIESCHPGRRLRGIGYRDGLARIEPRPPAPSTPLWPCRSRMDEGAHDAIRIAARHLGALSMPGSSPAPRLETMYWLGYLHGAVRRSVGRAHEDDTSHLRWTDAYDSDCHDQRSAAVGYIDGLFSLDPRPSAAAARVA